MDSQSEFDFICESATLEDARQNEHNLFRKIVQADTAASSKKNTPVPNDNSMWILNDNKILPMLLFHSTDII